MLSKVKAWLLALGRAIGRESVQITGLAAALIQFVSATFFPLDVNQQGALNAAVVALAGFIAAVGVSKEKAAPALAGLLQAVLAAVLSFGVHLDPQVQSSAMAFVSAVVAWYLRTQVEARFGPARGKHEPPVNRQTAPITVVAKREPV